MKEVDSRQLKVEKEKEKEKEKERFSTEGTEVAPNGSGQAPDVELKEAA